MKKDEPLWGVEGFQIPHIGLTGELGQGKTLFGLTIDPEHTLNIDLEDSSATFASTMPVKRRVSMYSELGKKFGGKMPTPKDAFIWFRDFIESVEPGEYRVLFVDPINDIERGLQQYVQENPEEFGLTRKQVTDASGLLWGALKAWWKFWLGMQSAKFECFVFTAHIGAQWNGGRPDPIKKKSKGTSVLREIASLFIHLERQRDSQGHLKKLPTGIVFGDTGKERLCVWSEQLQEPVPIAPPRIDPCTPDKIREYIKNPVGLRDLKPEEELPPPRKLSDDERLIIQAQMAEDQAKFAEAKIMTMDAIGESRKAEAEPVKAEEKSVDPLLQDIQESGDKQESINLLQLVRSQFSELGLGQAAIEKSCSKRKPGAKTLEELGVEELEDLRGALQMKLNEKN